MKMSVMLTVSKDTNAGGVLIPAGTYAGQEWSRADMNSPGGARVSYLLTIGSPSVSEHATFVEPQEVDVSHLVRMEPYPLIN